MNIKNKKNGVLLILLALIVFCAYFLFLGSYPLLDLDETRYVDMARKMLDNKDFLTLYLNGEYFFEKPPLFFWIECLSFKILGFVNEFSARLPIVLLSLLPLFMLYKLCKQVKNSRYAFVVCSILLTSIEYILITKIAILDSVFTSLSTSAVLSYFYTFFCKDKNKKYFWLLTYFLTALAVLAKGIPAIAIVFSVIFFATIIFATYKETLKYSLLGLILFFSIILPWHVLMLKMYPQLFFDEYIYKHHILRFLGSKVIDRTQPWYFYLITLLWGFAPHSFVVIPKLFKKFQFKALFKPKDDFSKLITLSTLASLLILLFFSSSKAKLITYIMPIYPFLAILAGNVWINYIKKDDKIIKYILLTLNSLFVAAVFITPFVMLFLPKELNIYLTPILTKSVIIVIPFTYLIINNILKNRRLKAFVFEVLFFAVLFGVVSPSGYKLDYSFGQNDLMKFAQIAKENNQTISTYMTGRKYSLLYYSDLEKIEYQTIKDINWLKKELKKENNMVIVRNKDVKELPIEIVIEGAKFSVAQLKKTRE